VEFVTVHNVPMMLRERWKHRLAITLYEHGHSAPSVGELLDMPTWEVSKIVTRAGVGRSRKEAAQITKDIDRRQTQHVTLLTDIAENLAAKINLSADLLLDVLAYRLSARGVPEPTSEFTEPQPNPNTTSQLKRTQRHPPTCVSLCDFGCTHPCAKTVGGDDTARHTEG
jgi:hypothetical protein